MDNVKKFYDALAGDEAMKKRAEALNEKHASVTPGEDIIKAEIIAFAKAEGYAFTADELEAYANQAKPLDDDELNAVAGGAFNPRTCFCAVGGGGTDSVTGRTCACVMGGVGKNDETDHLLFCVLAGVIRHKDDPLPE